MTDNNFKKALESVLISEGGFNDIKEDKGGATNFGISLRLLQLIDKDITRDGHIDRDDILALTKDSAGGIYKEIFWDHYRLSKIDSQELATKMFDMFVNMRGQMAAKICQSALIDCGRTLVVDGSLGNISFGLLNTEMATNGVVLMNHIREQQANVYRRIVENDSTQQKFLKGWLNRAKK
jgi:lysozyme family protein